MERQLIYVPIERLPERYSAQWDDWFRSAFSREGINYWSVGDSLTRTISTGEFLDAIETNAYKSRQLSEIVSLVSSVKGKKPITVFFMDLWFPGIEMLAYIRDATGWDIRITGMLHAGSYDPNDFLYQKGMGAWARSFEQALFSIVDTIFVATHYHIDLLKKAGLPTRNCTVVEWPVETEFKTVKKEQVVVFPHRLAKEKRPDLFDTIRTLYKCRYNDSSAWVRSKDQWTDKNAYYALLERSSVSVSTAEQETFGIAMVESYNAGCFCVVPNKLSYKELFPTINRYNTLEEAVSLIHVGLSQYSNQGPLNPTAKELLWINTIF